MIGSDIRLYTWVDVEDVLLRAQKENQWEGWLIWVRAYWDGLTLGIQPGFIDEAKKWLLSIFDPRINAEGNVIFLESLSGEERLLEVHIEETTDKPLVKPFIPKFSRPSVIWHSQDWLHPHPLPNDYPPIIAFHSFKGGVGRTIHALALANVLASSDDMPILIIDADLEAPGLTWLARKRYPSSAISFTDLLALIHGDPDPEVKTSIALVVDRVQEMFFNNMYFLPAFRTDDQFKSLEVKPEHLIRSDNPFFLTDLLAYLGYALGVKAVIVDLRAGLSELASGLLLDPRVYRVLVTTLSTQSMQGTLQLLDILGKTTPPKNIGEPVPIVVISQIPSDVITYESQLLSSTVERIYQAFKNLEGDNQLDDSSYLPTEKEPPQIITTEFDPRLLVLPEDWEETLARLRESSISQSVSSVIEFLPDLTLLNNQQIMGTDMDIDFLQRTREDLSRFAHSLIYAETGQFNKFLTIASLNHLASDFAKKLPIAIVIGAKGSGKTYTFIQITRRQTWQKFVEDAIEQSGVDERTIVIPALSSRNLKPEVGESINTLRNITSRELEFNANIIPEKISTYIGECLRKDLHESEWRVCWLNIIAWSVGFQTLNDNAGRNFVDHLRERKQNVLAVIDGLEDILQSLNSDLQEQKALRALLQDLPEWLDQQPVRVLGLLVFIREDMVRTAIKQNAGQFIARYEPYHLKWSPEEALRLVAWVIEQAQINIFNDEQITDNELQEKNQQELTELLFSLWGRKLGSANANEARSAAWIVAALSDFKGQVQARDIVRFLDKAAQESKGDTRWRDRVLIPTAVRNAVQFCSSEKIKEISEENPRLKEIFDKLIILSEESKRVPFTRENSVLDSEELQLLVTSGVILLDKQEYYLPEIFRSGLGFKLRAGARPRVLALLRRVRK